PMGLWQGFVFHFGCLLLFALPFCSIIEDAVAASDDLYASIQAFVPCLICGITARTQMSAFISNANKKNDDDKLDDDKN
ncbi:MAG: hypothetical protein AAFQ51_03635, partial [Pseudomonadota bacterium]